MEEKILEILKDIKPGTDFESGERFVSGRLLKSLDIVSLISDLEDEFDIEISAEDIIPDNFETINDMVELIKKCEK